MKRTILRSLIGTVPALFVYCVGLPWVALRLDTGKVDWREVKDLLQCSYSLVAPKKLAEQARIDG